MRQLHRLIDHALFVFVVAQLNIPRQREILAQRVTIEAVIGEDTAQIRVTFEHDAVHIPHFALAPACCGEHRHGAGHDHPLAHRHFYTDTAVFAHRQQMVDHLEPLGAAGIIHCRDVNQLREAAMLIIAQERQQLGHMRRIGDKHQLITRHMLR